VLGHRLEQRDARDKVVVVVGERARDGLADGLVTGKVNDGVEAVGGGNYIYLESGGGGG